MESDQSEPTSQAQRYEYQKVDVGSASCVATYRTPALSSHEQLVQRLQQIPLIDRLEEVQKRIGNMASSGRGIKMCIPVEHTDDDFFICQTARDAIKVLRSNADAPKAVSHERPINSGIHG